MPNYGFNQLHMEVLTKKGEDLEQFHRNSVHKKANTNQDITPIHCAAINPNFKYLQALLDAGGDINLMDRNMRRPIHYAAACESDGPLNLLIERGANVDDWDDSKTTPLLCAAMAGRAETTRRILAVSAQMIHHKDKKNMSALAYACKFGYLEVVKELAEHKAKINVGVGM